MSESLKLTVERLDGLAILNAEGYLNSPGGVEIVRTASGLMEQGYRVLLLNLSGTKIVNLQGLSFLSELFDKVKGIQGRLAFCSLTPTLGKIFRILRLGQETGIFADQESAVSGLLQRG
jgi:anti-anti-sigma regulatory factor